MKSRIIVSIHQSNTVFYDSNGIDNNGAAILKKVTGFLEKPLYLQRILNRINSK